MKFTHLKLCVIYGETSGTTRAQKIAIMSLLFHYMRKHLLPLKLPDKNLSCKWLDPHNTRTVWKTSL